MCLRQPCNVANVPSLIAFKVMDKVYKGYRPIFRDARYEDGRIFESNTLYDAASIWNGFSGCTNLDDILIFYQQVIGLIDHKWDTEYRQYINPVVVIVELSKKLQSETYEKQENDRSAWPLSHVTGLSLKIISELDITSFIKNEQKNEEKELSNA